MAMSETLSPYLMMTAMLGLDHWLVQRAQVGEKEERVVFFLACILGTIATVIAFAAAPLLAWFFKEPQVVAPFRVLSLTFLLRALQIVPEAKLRRRLAFDALSSCALATTVVRSLSQVLLAWYGLGFWALVTGSLLREVISCAWLLLLTRQPLRISWDFRLAREAIRFGGLQTGATILWIVFATFDNLVVVRLFGTEVLGYYAMAFYLADLPLAKINGTFNPLFSAYYSRVKQTPALLRVAFCKISALIFALVTPALLGALIVADLAVPLVLGEHWSPMTTPLEVMCLLGVLRAVFGNSPALFLACGRPDLNFWGSFANALLLPPLFYFLARFAGLSGIYFAWLIVYPITPAILMVRLYHLLDLPASEHWRYLKPSAISAVSMTLIAVGMREVLGGYTGWEALGSLVIIGAACYALVYRLLYKSQFDALVQEFRLVLRGGA